MDNAKEHTAPRGVKLTAVTFYQGPWMRKTVFLPLNHDSRGRAVVPMNVLAEARRHLFSPK